MRTILVTAAVFLAAGAAPALAQSNGAAGEQAVGSSPGVAGVPGAADANGNSQAPAQTLKHKRSSGSSMAMNRDTSKPAAPDDSMAPDHSDRNNNDSGQAGQQPTPPEPNRQH